MGFTTTKSCKPHPSNKQTKNPTTARRLVPLHFRGANCVTEKQTLDS